MLQAGQVFDGARALLNDINGQVYTNDVQLPFFQMAFEEVRQELQDYNIPITNKTSAAILIPYGVKDIGGPTGPPLPNDFIELLECWEIPAGTNNDYMQMRRKIFLPKTDILTAYLEVYTWADQYIHFLGANGDIQVKLDYIASGLGPVVNENSVIRLTNVINVLKFRTAAYCAMFIGENETRASVLNEKANEALDTMLGIQIKNTQRIQTRRRPFMASYKQRGPLSGR